MNLSSTSGILIDLDCLFDTRLATLKGLSDAYVTQALKANYRERITDNFVELIPDIDMEAYKDLYKRRGIPTIQTAAMFPTAIIIELAITVREHIKMATQGPMSGKPVLAINTYPYDLTREEIDSIVSLVKHDLNEPLCEVTSVRLSPSQITPALLKNKYKVSFIYHLSEWMTGHEAAIKALAPIDIVVFAPKLFVTGKLNTLPDYQLYDGINIGNLATELHMQYFRLELIDAMHFSFIDVALFKKLINGKKR